MNNQANPPAESISFENVSFSYGGRRGRTHRILRDVSFSAGSGECVVIAGTNGSGKSTLLSLAAGILKPTGGRIRINGRIGYVPQGSALLEDATVAENLKFFSDLAGAAIPDPLPFEVGSWLGKRVSTLSGGMKKQVSIACAMAGDPEIFLLDEPCGALDIRFRDALAGLIAEWKANGKTVLYIGHEPSEFASFCDRFLFLTRNGSVPVFREVPRDENALRELMISLTQITEVTE